MTKTAAILCAEGTLAGIVLDLICAKLESLGLMINHHRDYAFFALVAFVHSCAAQSWILLPCGSAGRNLVYVCVSELLEKALYYSEGCGHVL